MATRLGREVRVSPVTLPLVITALRHYADDLTIASALGTAEYQVREWDARGGLVRELAVCRDATAAYGALEAAAFANPTARLTMGQNARILRACGPGVLKCRFRDWACRPGASLPMRMAASWLRSQRIHRIQGCDAITRVHRRAPLWLCLSCSDP